VSVTIYGNHPDLAFEVEMVTSERVAVAEVRRDGGEWRISLEGGGWLWLAAARIEWPEAMKRAVVKVQAQLKEHEK
jgi:hypothetical protein